MTREELTWIYDALKEISINGPSCHRQGLCENLIRELSCHKYNEKKTQNIYDWLMEVFESWPYFSGDHHFPVSSSSVVSPEDEYVRAGDMWDIETEYGKLRLDLLYWLIEQAEKQLDQLEVMDEGKR